MSLPLRLTDHLACGPMGEICLKPNISENPSIIEMLNTFKSMLFWWI